MCENICRICASENKKIEAFKLFERKNRKLLRQLKDITGVMLKNSIGLPKLMCTSCHKTLIDAHKFRENFLNVQASFRVKLLKENKKQKCNGLMESTEFVQVFIVKEEKDIGCSEHEDYSTEEEKEINLNESQVSYKKDDSNFNNTYINEINALELKPNEENILEDHSNFNSLYKNEIKLLELKPNENTLEDPENNTHNILDRDEIDANFDDLSKGSSDDGHSKKSNTFIDEEFIPTQSKSSKTHKAKPRGKKKQKGEHQKDTKEPLTSETKIFKPRKKRKDADEHADIFICDQCGNHFTCRHHFKLHLRRHTGDKQCACELCPDKFFTSSELRRHMRKHTGERPFACKFCDRKFTDYSTRIKHERTHTNERPFMCSQCGKSFTTSYILKNHMLTHTGERHFKCDVCNRAFTRRTHLVVHFRSIMHKQAVEKDKQPISQQELPQPQHLIPPSTHIPPFLV